MRYLYLLFLGGCTAAPTIIQDITKPSIMGELLKQTPNTHTSFWFIWYGLLFLVLGCWWYTERQNKEK